MAIAHDAPRRPAPKPRRKIPESLIYEIMDGKAIYRKGYRDVLLGKKTLEEIMGSSSLQAIIVYYLTSFISRFINEDMYNVLVNEAGLHLDHRTNLANDIAIFEQHIFPGNRLSKKFADVPPKIAIEVDIIADVAEMTETGYIYKKTRKLFDFGVQKIIWVLTEPQVVLIATPERIETVSWDIDIEIMDGHAFNIGAFLAKKGFNIE